MKLSFEQIASVTLGAAYVEQTENGVAYIYITHEVMEKFGLTYEQASACVSHLDSIKGSLIWIAFIDSSKSDEIRVRLRSRFVTINKLGEKYEGGGHACASGATVHSEGQMFELLLDADKLLAEFKANNEGWL